MNQILFLSNDPVLRQKNIEILTQGGLETSGVADCLNGLLVIDKEPIDVAVIDEELNDVSGYEACLQVRQHTDMPIILLGSVTESEVWTNVENLGFDLYLRKPVSPRELMARIKALLRRPASEQEDSVPTKQKIAEPRFVAESSHKVELEPAQPAEYSQKKPEPIIAQGETELPIQIVPPIKNDGSEVRAAPPQSQMVTPQSQVVSQEHISPQQQCQTSIPPVETKQSQVQVPPVQPVNVRYADTIAKPSKQETVKIEQGQAAPQREQVVLSPTNEQMSTPKISQESSTGEVVSESALEDVRILRLVDALVSGKLTEITPVIDLSLKLGYNYPSVDSLLDTVDEDTVNVLENLAKNEILIKKPFEKLYIDPENLMQLVPIERCPRCDSSNLVKGQLVEHFYCGYVGLDKEFKQEGRYICPKCHRELRLIGTDYRNIGIHYRCLDCNEIFATPVVKWRNLKTRKIWNAEELREVAVYSYAFSPDKKGWLEFQLKPKTQLIDFLTQQGYQVQELAQLTGSSGAMHTVDILAIKDDILTKINLGIGILVAPAGETEVGLEALFKFDTRAYDIGINYKVVIAIPKLGHEAINFANRQVIRTFEAKTLGTVVSDITGTPRSRAAVQSSTETGGIYDGQQLYSSIPSARTTIVRFLRNRGYEVFERAQITGKSGADHIFDIYARRDDKIIMPTMVIGIASDATGQPVGVDELARFDAAAYDSGIRNKIFLGIPVINTQARQFARQQRIDIIEPSDLGKLI